MDSLKIQSAVPDKNAKEIPRMIEINKKELYERVIRVEIKKAISETC